jgi:hypothetical protein
LNFTATNAAAMRLFVRGAFSERYLLPIFLLKPVRCVECFRRDYRLIFVPVKERIHEAVKKVATSAPRPNRNVA